MTIEELERELKHAQAMAEQPKFAQTRRIFWQAHARAIQARIEVLESSQLAFESMEQVRQGSLL